MSPNSDERSPLLQVGPVDGEVNHDAHSDPPVRWARSHRSFEKLAFSGQLANCNVKILDNHRLYRKRWRKSSKLVKGEENVECGGHCYDGSYVFAIVNLISFTQISDL